MSHFYGCLNGQAGPATRRGSKNSGLKVTAASWNGAINVYLHHNPKTGKDEYHIELTSWHGTTPIGSGIIAEGTIERSE